MNRASQNEKQTLIHKSISSGVTILSHSVDFLILLGNGVQLILFSPYFLSVFIIRFLFLSLKKSNVQRPQLPPITQIHVLFQTLCFRIGSFIKNIVKQITIEIIKAVFSLKTFVLFFFRSVAGTILSIPKAIQVCIRFLKSIYFRFFVLGFLFALITFFVYSSFQFVLNLPNPDSIGTVNFAQSSYLYDRNGKLLYEVYRDVKRTAVELDSLPPYIAFATISIEDKNFYNHKGISVFGGILRAVKESIETSQLQGGSTITQQLIKTSLLTPERTIERKIKEAILALWAERIYSKNTIMELYLNQVPYGGASYGIEEASKVYFNKHAKDLTLSEAALLAGLPKAPSVFSPFVNKELAIQRRNLVLKNMNTLGYISVDEYERSINEELVIQPQGTNIRAPHFVMYAREELDNEYGSRNIEEGGFHITTTIDLEIQDKAEEILREELAKIEHLNVTNGGIVVLQPGTGAILAMVGSKNYFEEESGAFNVTTAKRQPGSTLKPILYSLALQRGYTAATLLDDSPVVFDIAGSKPYIPVNYDGRFHGKVPLRYALANSYNVPAVKTLNSIGVDSFVNYARKLGIDTWDKDPSYYGLSVGLGGAEVTLLDIAEAYSVFASRGLLFEPTTILRIENSQHRLVDDLQPTENRVVDESISFIISDILSDNQARQLAFGRNSALEIVGQKVAVKTGTSNDKKDNLTIGYTPDYVVAVWVGNNDNTPMHPTLTSGVTGAATIWNRVMTYLLSTSTSTTPFYSAPETVVQKPCYGKKIEYFLKGTEISTGCYWSVLKPKNELSPTPQVEANIQ